MNRIQVKLFAENLRPDQLESFVPVFHRWIREDVLDEMVIDVADYTHVPEGPGVVLIGHAADYYVDISENRPGLIYSRKRDLPEGAHLVEDALRRVLRGAEILSTEEDLSTKPTFSKQEILLRLPERLFVQNDDESFERVRGDVTAAFERVFPEQKFTLSREGDPRAPLTIRARVAS